MKYALATLGVFTALAGTQIANAACPTDDEVSRFRADWTAKVATTPMPVETMADAVCARDKFVAGLGGRVVGYKAALTNKAIQARFNASEPVLGTLTEGMILPDKSLVAAKFGHRPFFEADMLLVVKDDGINAARSAEEAARHISGMRPFIELPDLALAETEKLGALQLISFNAAARLGVAGDEVPLPSGEAMVKLLAGMHVIMKDGSGATLAEGIGSDILGNPLNVVMWVAADLAKSGGRLKAGDLVSVGTFAARPAKSGIAVSVEYSDLPGPPKVSVSFD